MLDLKFIRENLEQVKRSIKNHGMDLDVDELLRLDNERARLLQAVERVRHRRNVLADEIGRISEDQRQEKIAEGKKIREELVTLDQKLHAVHEELYRVQLQIPNTPFDDVPIGSDEKDNEEVRIWGEIPSFDFPPKDHVARGQTHEHHDFERASKVAGHGFAFLKNDGVFLELALVAYGIDFLTEKGFTPFVTPDLARSRYYLGTGFLPKGPEAQTYTLEGIDLGLVATAEVTLAGYHADEVLSGADLPKRYMGYSHCFRREAGSYGQEAKGLYRMHQFTKVELFIYCRPEESRNMHDEIVALEEAFWQSLKVPYRVVEMCTADLGAMAAKKFDLEAWMPGRGDWGEVTSASNVTDYQARRLNIRFVEKGKRSFVHMLNGTLVATPRAMIAILENFQTKDGAVVVPEVLRPYLKKDVLKKTP